MWVVLKVLYLVVLAQPSVELSVSHAKFTTAVIIWSNLGTKLDCSKDSLLISNLMTHICS
jgi:hypothetical protein